MSDSKIIQQFKKLYPEPKTELNFRNPYELSVSVLLSAQCTDKKVNEVTINLFKTYPDFQSLSKAPVREIENIIRQVNYYKTKSKHLVQLGSIITEQHKGKLPSDHYILTTLPGIGRKTANVICSELGHSPAFPVDTHVFRVSKRLRLAEGSNVRSVEDELCKRFDKKVWRPLHHWLILHGRKVCKAQRPLCAECTLNRLCPSSEN